MVLFAIVTPVFAVLFVLAAGGLLLSGGTVPVINAAVGVAVAAAVVLLLAGFLEQAIVLRDEQ